MTKIIFASAMLLTAAIADLKIVSISDIHLMPMYEALRSND